MTPKEFDLIAIGGGTGGLVAAAGAAYLGVNSAIVEKAALGGDCLWTGCVPSKALIASSRLAHEMEHADLLGLTPVAPGHDFPQVMERLRQARGVVEHHDDPERFRAMGVTVEFGEARFVSRDTLEVEGVGRMRARRIVVATGATPIAPPIPGLAEAGYLDHHTLWDLDALPSRLVVLGGGPIGIEMGQALSRLGADVDVVEMATRILPRDDADLSARLQESLEAEGMGFHLGVRAERVERDGDSKVVLTDSGDRLVADEIFVATGRRPATEGLGLEVAGIDTERSAVRVDDRLRTTNPGVWAVGDVTGGMQFTHVAEHMAKTVLRNALVPGSRRISYDTVPTVTYTDPGLAHVGPPHDESAALGGRTLTYEIDDLDRAIVDGTARGLVKVTADRKGRVMSASVLGSHAGDLLFPWVLAKQNGIPLSRISGTIFPYPTMVESVKRMSDAFQRERLDSPSGRLLKRIVRWLA